MLAENLNNRVQKYKEFEDMRSEFELITETTDNDSHMESIREIMKSIDNECEGFNIAENARVKRVIEFIMLKDCKVDEKGLERFGDLIEEIASQIVSKVMVL